ncbi:MAG: hypothetical protein V4582_13590 [Pseudomonadota bacterium]
MKVKTICAVLLAVLSTSAMAESKNQSISVFANYTKPSQGDGVGSAFGSYGFMLQDNVELNFSAISTFSSGETTTGLGAGANYYFGAVGRAGSTVPYVGVSAFHMSSSTQGRIAVGLDHAITEAASLKAELAAGKGSGDNSGTTMTMNLGLTVRF